MSKIYFWYYIINPLCPVYHNHKSVLTGKNFRLLKGKPDLEDALSSYFVSYQTWNYVAYAPELNP